MTSVFARPYRTPREPGRRSRSWLATAVLLAAAATSTGVATGPSPAAAVTPTPGGIFVTGHDPDSHAWRGLNEAGAQNIIRRAVGFVTDSAEPRVLLVASAITPPAGHSDPAAGVRTVYPSLHVAGAPDGVNTAAGLLDLSTVDFGSYDVVVVASDFGGTLRQHELDLLNARGAQLIDYVNSGGGLVAFAESNSGARLTPAGGHFDFLPFLATEQALNQNEVGYTVTAFGQTVGLGDADVNGNASHNVFVNTGGMEVVNVDADGRFMSLATRQRICPGGVPQATVSDVSQDEGTGPTTAFTFTVSLDLAPCGVDVVLGYTTADATATSPGDYVAQSGSLVFHEGETMQSVTVPVVADAIFESDEIFYLNLTGITNGSISDGQGMGTIVNDDSPNGAPDCSTVRTDQAELWPADHTMRTVTLAGATDPDGDPVSLSVTAVRQDEPVNGTGDGNLSPDAALTVASDAVDLRVERSGTGDGRVYLISYDAADASGATCSATVAVSVRQSPPKPAVDSGATHDSFS